MRSLVGKLIIGASRGNLKKVILELGGKSPNVIFDDANFDQAIAGAADVSKEQFDRVSGYKQSGWVREMGHAALANYLQTKSVCISIGNK
jgi:acyl-CoA reductase-like NAD-dependent aldehyde dehydrogenase